MKKYLTTLLVAIISFQSFGQDACTKYNGNYTKIKNEITRIVNDHKDDFTVPWSGFSEDDIEGITNYWVSVCKCKVGVSSREAANETIKAINLPSWSSSYTCKTGVCYKDMSIFGSLKPDGRVVTATACMGAGTDNAGNITKYDDCTSFTTKAEDPQRFITDYKVAKCMCEKGVSSKSEADQFFVQMQMAYDGYKTNYVKPSIDLQNPNDLKPCPIIKTKEYNNFETKDKFSIYKDPLIGQGAQNLIHDLAANSNNPKLKAFSADLQKIDQYHADMAHKFSQIGYTPTQSDMEFQQILGNAAQIIAIGKAIASLFEKQEKELPIEIKQANSYILDLTVRMQMIYNESKIIKPFPVYNKKTLGQIDEIEKSYLSYDLATAVERYLLIQYIDSEYWFTMQEINDLYKKIDDMNRIDIIKKIDLWQKENVAIKKYYLMNSDISFKLNRDILNTKRAQCYKNMGQENKANEILEKIFFDVSDYLAIKSMSDAYKDGNYELANYFYPIVKKIYETEKEPKTLYTFHKDENNVVITRSQVIQQLALGSYTAIQKKNYTEATQEVNFLDYYVNRKPQESYYETYNKNDLAILKALKSALLNLTSEKEDALQLIEEALTEADFSTKPIIRIIKFNILVENNLIQEALDLYVNINQDLSLGDNIFINVYELKYKKCELLFINKEYNRVLNGLSILETAKPLAKYHIMRYEVYTAQGKTAAAITELKKYESFKN